MERNFRKDTQPTPGIQKALAYIEMNLHRSISLTEVAEHIYLNANYFSALFRERMGINFSEYITQKRLEVAKRRLLETDDSISQISETVGYQTAKYFTHLFKKYEGMTPSSYRKMKRSA